MNRQVFCQDARLWLENNKLASGHSLVASMPDISEFPHFGVVQWKSWFVDMTKLILQSTPEASCSIFFQSDIKLEGLWVDKGYLCLKAAEELGHELLWHKIVCRAPAGVTTFGRPAYSHLLCFSKTLKLDPARSSADVMTETGDKTWQRGMGAEVALFIAQFLQQQAGTHTVVNPFCGEGAMLAAANSMGLNAIGIERSPKRAYKAEGLLLSEEKTFYSPTERTSL